MGILHREDAAGAANLYEADVIPFCSALFSLFSSVPLLLRPSALVRRAQIQARIAPRRREVSKAEEFFAQNQVFPLDKIQEPQNALSRPIGRRFWNQGLSGFGGSGSERRREAGADDGRASGYCGAGEQRAREGGVVQLRLHGSQAAHHDQPGSGGREEGRVGLRLADGDRDSGGCGMRSRSESVQVSLPGGAFARWFPTSSQGDSFHGGDGAG